MYYCDMVLAFGAGGLFAGWFVYQGLKAVELEHDKLFDAAKMLYDNVLGYTKNPTLTMRGSDFGLLLAPEMHILKLALHEDTV